MPISLAAAKSEIQNIGRARLYFLSYVTIGHLFIHWYINLLSLILPSIKEQFELNDVQVGAITTTQMGVTGAATLPAGYLSDTFRKQGSLILATAVFTFGLAYFVIGAANNYAWILVGAGLTGLGVALWHPGAMGALSLNFPQRRGLALSVHGVGASIGDTICPVIVGAIIGIFAWQDTMRWHFIPAIVGAFFIWRSLGLMRSATTEKPNFQSYVSGLRGMFTNLQAVIVLLSNALVSAARLIILTFLPIYIQQDLGYSPFILGVYLMLLYVMGIASQPIMGIVSDRYGRKAVMLPAFAILGLLYIALVYVGGGIGLGVVVALLGMFFYAILNIAQTAIMDVAEEGVQSSTMGVMGLVSQPFTLGAPILAGFLVGIYGTHIAFWFAGIAALCGAFVLIPIRFRKSI